jgi:Fe2+ transport system protein FeoA
MATRTSPSRLRSMAGARAGETLRVERILFDALRARCAALGVHEGSNVRCRSVTPTRLVLETGGGRTVLFERDWARFIQVS